MAVLNLLILGGGNGPHCYSALAASLPDVNVRVLTLYEDEAARWTKSMEHNPFQITFTEYEQGRNEVFTTTPNIVTKDPKLVVPGSHLIVFMVPAFAHTQYFEAIKPYLEHGMIICGLPGGGGFMFQALHALGDDISNYCLLSFSTLPWACRIEKFYEAATILAVKDTISGGGMGATEKLTVLKKTPAETVAYTLLGKTVCHLQGHLLGDTLNYGNAFVHPSIEYGTWSTWDGKPMDEKPEFYHGATELAAEMVGNTSSEALKMRDEILRRRPDIDLGKMVHKYDWYCETYSDDIVGDKTNLYTIFHTHKGYEGIKHPMVETDDGKFLPDFKHRYFTEDIPCGQVVLKGIAEILGIETPNLDRVITWAQGVMGKEYLVDGKLEGKDRGETRCPQRFGITTLEGMLGETR